MWRFCCACGSVPSWCSRSSTTSAGLAPGAKRYDVTFESVASSVRKDAVVIGEPAKAVRPRCSSHSASNDEKISMRGWWSVTAIARPLAAYWRSTTISSSAEHVSRPLVGSSRKSSGGPRTISIASESFRFCPPESPPPDAPPTTVSLTWRSPIESISCSTSALRSHRLMPGRRISAEYAMFCLTVSRSQ